MTELDLVELRESAEEPYAFDFDGHEDLILALIDRLEAAERERDSANQSDRIKTGEINVLTRENRALRTAIEEFDPLVVLENGLPADPTSLDWWDAEPGDLCRAIADSAIGLRAALAPQSPEEGK